jgi:NAD(P)-dependent dehydrogenase (short-subunit alcohol dehydrogenase family)
MNQTNKVVIVTGAAFGIGRATALRFPDAGATVVLSDIATTITQPTSKEDPPAAT